MRLSQRPLAHVAVMVVLAGSVASAVAAPPSDVLLPRTVKGYVSVGQAEEFDARWNRTQLGQLLDDELMQPFLEDFRRQRENGMDVMERKLGVTWDDLEGVSTGELSLSILERPGRDAVLAITIDVRGRRPQADALLATIERRFAARAARRQTMEVADTTLRIFDLPPAPNQRHPQTTVYFIRDDVLVGIDDRAEAEAILGRFVGQPRDNLRSVAAYGATMERARREAGDLEPEVRWFAEPFGFIFAARTLRDTPGPRGRDDYARIFSEQGFDAIRGVGGFVNLLVEGDVEILHRTSIYAPPVPGREEDPLRWTLSMRMVQLPNISVFEQQAWVSRMSACYLTFNLDMMAAFDNFGPIFDALRGHAGAWRNTLEGWEVDPYGAQINVRSEFIANLGQRITVVTDYVEPITIDSERSLIAIEATNERALADALARWMTEEPDVVRRMVDGIEVWERVPPEAVAVDRPQLPGFGALQPRAPAVPEDSHERVMPRSASCVAMGHLFLASDIESLREILAGFPEAERLAASADYQQVLERLNRFAPGQRSGWSFVRTDEYLQPTYELIRQGEMPGAETILGRVLNELLTTELEREEGIPRRQRIDGRLLPEFNAIRHYIGLSGFVLRSEADGWMLTGAMLNGEAP